MPNNLNQRFAWISYDFGNSAYALIVMTIFYPLFFSTHILPGTNTEAVWGGTIALSILVAGVASPFLGAYCDMYRARKRMFVISALCAIAGTIALPFATSFPWYISAGLFVIVNSAFGISLFLYDSFLVIVRKAESASTMLSSLGWAIGYVGGLICLFIAYMFLGARLPENLEDYRSLFMVTGGFYLLCSAWPLIVLQEPPAERSGSSAAAENPFHSVCSTLRSWRKNKPVFVFLFGMYFIMDGLTTVVYFVSLFTERELGFSLSQIVNLFVIVQIVALFATIAMGWLAERYGDVEMLIVCCVIWTVIILCIFVVEDYHSFRYISAATGFVIGSTPAIARGYLAKVIPRDKRAEFFGFNSLAGRLATLIGPLMFGVVSSFGNRNIALLTILPFFVIGAIILARVRTLTARAIP